MFFRPSRQKKIILHIGLPKTGSTSLQQILYQSRDSLLKQGVVYPGEVHNLDDPKHNFVLEMVRKGISYDISNELGYKNASRVVISNEAISNDFYIHGMERNRHLADQLRVYGELEVCMVLRHEREWLHSYYKQAVINQPVKGKQHYQNSLPLAEFRELEPVRRLLNHGELTKDVSDAFQAPVRIIRYENISVPSVVAYCTGLSGIKSPLVRRDNESLPSDVVEVMRQLNAQIESLEEKYAWSRLLMLTCSSNHSVLKILAGRATEESMAKLDEVKLERLVYIENATPDVSENNFSVIVSGLKRNLSFLRCGA